MTIDLTLRRIYPGDPDERNREHFWTVSSEGVYVGVIVYHATLPKPMWGWSITVQYQSPGIGKIGDGDSRDDAMRKFREAWDAYPAWLGDDRWQRWIKDVKLVDARAVAMRY